MIRAELEQCVTQKVQPSLSQQLAETLVRKSYNPKDLVAEWDRKHKGEINKVEFRQGVRGMGIKADNKDLDALFDSIDSDGVRTPSRHSQRAGGWAVATVAWWPLSLPSWPLPLCRFAALLLCRFAALPLCRFAARVLSHRLFGVGCVRAR